MTETVDKTHKAQFDEWQYSRYALLAFTGYINYTGEHRNFFNPVVYPSKLHNNIANFWPDIKAL